MYYIASTAKPRCSGENRFQPFKRQYRNQRNARMDWYGFDKWVTSSYGKVRKVKTDDVLIIKDNCGGHETNITLPGLRIELLSKRSTYNSQTLDLRSITHAKIRVTSCRGQYCVLAFQREWLPLSADSGRFGIRDGHQPQVGDGMDMFNRAWHKTKRKTIMKAWMNGKCLSDKCWIGTWLTWRNERASW